jgi:glycine/serine hydroxymethyltransferase
MNLSEQARQLTEKVIENNTWRQRYCFNLIPSENTPSLLVKVMEISDPSGRYAEHRTMKGNEVYFYQGIDFIRDVEEATREQMCTYFNCPRAELRAISGQMANEVVFKAVTAFVNRGRSEGEPWRRIRSVMNNELTRGGHLSSQPMGALYNYVEFDKNGKERVTNFPICKDNLYKIDTDVLGNLLIEAKPELIIFGKSMFLYREPVKFVSDIIKAWDPKPIVMYDMAHVLGLYGAFQEPFSEGADIVTGSTHKSFFGPQRGVIAASFGEKDPLSKLWLDIKSRVFPGSTSNHHLGTLLALLMSSYEMNAYKKEYQDQVCRNAKAFAKACKAEGLDVEGDPALGYTETHQVLIRVSKYGSGDAIARRLEENNIICNYQALPDDGGFLTSSGLRTGVPEMTRFGMKEADFGMLAHLVAECVIRNKSVKQQVSDYRQKFTTMHYCLPAAQAAELAARMFNSMFPNSDYAKMFAENLSKLC